MKSRAPLHSSARHVLSLLAAVSLGACGPVDDDIDVGVDVTHGEIIGGSLTSVATRRSLGLVDFTSTAGSSSGALLTPDWVITAAHAVDWTTPANNIAQIPRADGTLDQRTATQIVQAGMLDVAMVRLGSGPATWPSVTRAMSQANPATMPGKAITCYGRGMSGYKLPSGGLYDGKWRVVTRIIDRYEGGFLKFKATDQGTEMVGWGDSGGPCFVDNALVGTVKGGVWDCADQTNYNTCVATVTKIREGWVAPVASQAPYLDAAQHRTNATWLPLGLLNGWSYTTYNTNAVGVTLAHGTVFLRGAVVNASASASSIILQLPPGYRPSHTVYVPTNLYGARKGRLIITTDGNVSVQAEAAYADATSFTSLDGVSFELLATGHTVLPLVGGWTGTVYGTRLPAVADDGVEARFEGAMSSGTSSAPFTVPPSFRPSSRVYLPVDLCGARKGRLIIETNGSVSLSAETAWSDATCFTSLEGLHYPKATAGFTALTPLNGWATSPYSTRAPAVRNVSGIITFEGAISSTGTSWHAFTLPELFRPSTAVYVQADLCGGKKGRVVIQPSGQMSVEAMGGTFSTASCFTSLESVQFGI
jgi:hypothetical protein